MQVNGEDVIAYFANRHIRKGEELTLHYGEKYWKNSLGPDWAVIMGEAPASEPALLDTLLFSTHGTCRPRKNINKEKDKDYCR